MLYPGDGTAAIAEIVRNEGRDVIMSVTRDEVQPIVREALTEDVLRSVGELIKLTPRAVELLAEDLECPDATIRQRAYTLLLKYTAGHPALLQPKDADHGAQMVVNFGLPRPEAIAIEPDAVEVLVTCELCHEDKPAAEFESGSLRCRPCFETWRDRVLAEFA